MALKKITRQQWLKKELLRKINEEKLQAHDKFLSERKTSTEYHISVPTVRLVLQQLIEEGFIYRIHGKGTFISPQKNNKTILIVGKYDTELKSKEYALMDFLGGLLEEQKNRYPQYAPIVVNHNTFIEQLNDLPHIYPNLEGIAFFRVEEAAKRFTKSSSTHEYPAIFFGSDIHKNQLLEINGIYHREDEIIETGLEFLKKKKHSHIAYLHSEKSPALKSRKRIIERLQKKTHNISILELPHNTHFSHQDYYRHCEALLKNILPKSTTAIFCADDWLAMYAIQALKKLKKNVPEDIAVLGINDYPFAEFLDPCLSTLRIALDQGGKNCLQILAEKNPPKQAFTPSPQVIERQSA